MNSKAKMMLCGIFAIFLMCVISASVLSIDFPLPINGRLEYTDLAEGQIIKITNQRTGISEEVKVEQNSEYLYDWGNSENKEGTIGRYVLGDTFKIEIMNCEGNCVQEISYIGQPEIFISWDLMHTTLEDPKAPEESNNIPGILGLIIALILSIGGGMQIYKNRKGGITILHRHRGIVAYHNPDTQHRNPKYRHAKMSTAPVQYAKDIKKIETKGGLI